MMMTNSMTVLFFLLALYWTCTRGDIPSIIINQNHYHSQQQINISTIQWLKRVSNITEKSGKSIILECKVNSTYQPVTFQWYRFNAPIDLKKYHLNQTALSSTIRLYHLRESAAYTCEASNGHQTITSTGLIHVQSDNVDIPNFSNSEEDDDSLPSADFQPVILTNNDLLERQQQQPKCELYRGTMCRSVIGDRYISTEQNQDDIERGLRDGIELLKSHTLPNECRRLVLPLICLFAYPVCDNERINTRPVCRRTCEYFQDVACSTILEHRPYSNQVFQNIPACKSLPPASDDSSCISLDKDGDTANGQDCYTESGQNYTGLRNQTKFTRPCLNWHDVCRSETDRDDCSKEARHNYCRNIERLEAEPWCYVRRNDGIEREICGLLNCGDYGHVYQGEIIGFDNSSSIPTKCLIKTLHTDSSQQLKDEYARELELFCQIKHSNISCLLGVSVKPQDSMMMMFYERLNEGDLHEYLLQRSAYTSTITHHTRDLNDFIFISTQILSGMIYLTSRNFVHNDLSCKNILISEHMECKISNIGRCREKYRADYYKIANRCLPVRWLSLEALLTGVYSEMSDVWSFGVLLWEMFSYGQQPYHGATSPEAIEMIRDRKLLSCPVNCPKKIYALMCDCWSELIELRPTFSDIYSRFKQWEQKSPSNTSSVVHGTCINSSLPVSSVSSGSSSGMNHHNHNAAFIRSSLNTILTTNTSDHQLPETFVAQSSPSTSSCQKKYRTLIASPSTTVPLLANGDKSSFTRDNNIRYEV
ncbi:unnamed protein product [Didymodactylos carnosus]|uniref:Uncharacterized protein n=1 Tax=Didymodactylos carnosus TaxID=1234261 RepID=A0A813WCB7_9BILA|nr:unnamed protein product [Didymodactylos carnosus]CAF0884758.1 unnamed protein product [Didymodactylos carnosus]CAF3640684.1 unnamed protein product [Didymodactylos carnosus]CAF3667849.1 unnamed protein product [Didymodactylos carnosus]